MTVEELAIPLKSLRLSGMSSCLSMRYQEAKSHELDYLDFLSNLISDETVRRQSNLLNRRMKLAKFPDIHTLDDFDFSFNTSIKKRDVMALASSGFIYEARNILFIGPPGVGKSHLAIALGTCAIHNGYSVLYRSIFDLIQEVHEAEQNNKRKEYIRILTKTDLLILDELGMKKLPAYAAEDILEVIHRRYQKGSTIIATNRVVSDWGKILGDNAATAAILDRFLDKAVVFNIKGKSFRLKKGKE